MRTVFVCLLACALVPTVSAQNGLILGTEDLPELPDGVNDVQYDPLYNGPRDHAYIDLVAAWFDHDPVSDEVIFTMKVSDATALASTLDGWWPECRVLGALRQGEEVTGRLRFEWGRAPNGTVDHRVRVDSTESPTPGSVPNGRALKHAYNERLAEPGYFEFRVARADLLQDGELFENPTAVCLEWYAPHAGQGVIGPALAPLYTNQDDAESQAAYSFKDLRRARGPDGVKDPIEALPETATQMPSEPSAAESDATPGLPFAMALLAISAALSTRSRTRRIG